MKDNSGKVLLAMLAGASAGVIAGLLMAPDTGEVTRGSVKKWAGKMSKDLEKNLQDGLEEIKKMSGDTFSKYSEAMKGNKGGTSTGGSSTQASGSSTTGTSTGTSGGSTSGGSSTGGSSTGSTGGNA